MTPPTAPPTSTSTPAATLDPASAPAETVQPVGLSTAWNGARAVSMSAVLDEQQALGFQRLEAYCHFTPDRLRALATQAREREMEVASLHSPCPVPVDASNTPLRWTDGLASTDEAERTLAVAAIKRTVDAAVEVGARAIVIHLGRVAISSRQRLVFDTIAEHGRGSEPHRRLVQEALAEREAHKAPHLAAALRSIRALGEHAVGSGVRLGVECRDNYHEIPSLDELVDVLSATDGLPVGYWHDAGHGAKLEYGGFIPAHEAYLQRYGDHLVGMHIHDTRGPRDHQAPGQGDTDFAMLARYLRPDTIRTLELHATVTPAEITHALDLLGRLGGFGIREGIVFPA